MCTVGGWQGHADVAASTYTHGLAYSDVVHVVWEDRRADSLAPDIYYRRSLNGGYTWEPEVRLTFTGTASSPAVAASGELVHVVWEDNRAGKHEIYYARSMDCGRSWSRPVSIAPGYASSLNPDVAAVTVYSLITGSKSYVFVVWEQGSTGSREIYFVRSTDGGETWSTPQCISSDPADSKDPSIAVSVVQPFPAVPPEVTVHVVWLDNRDGVYEVYYARGENAGSSWSTCTRLSYSSGNKQKPTITASGNAVHVAWADDVTGSYEIWYMRSEDNGVSWLSRVKLTSAGAAGGIARGPSMWCSGSNVHIAWYDNRDGNLEVYYMYSVDCGSTWSGEVRLTSASGTSSLPSIAATKDIFYVVWMDARSGEFDIYFKSGFHQATLEKVYMIFRENTKVVVGSWVERPNVWPAATIDTAAAALVGYSLGAYGLSSFLAVFDSDVVDPNTLSWLDSSSNLISLGGPAVSLVSYKLDGSMGISWSTPSPDVIELTVDGHTWQVTSADEGVQDYFVVYITEDSGRFILVIEGATGWGTLAGGMFLMKMLQDTPGTIAGKTLAVVKWTASTPGAVTPSDTFTVAYTRS